MSIIIYPYKMSSKGARVLSQALGATRVYPDRNYRPKAHHMVINWGSSQRPQWYDTSINWRVHMNDISQVKIATNKLLAFQTMSAANVPIPECTTSLREAEEWVEEEQTVFCRTLLTGHSGAGIVTAKSHTELVEAPLYTKATGANKEYRVHIVNGNVVDFVQKKKKRDTEVNTLIRNHQNGWVFARTDVTLPDTVKQAALDAIKALELDFGAVDVGHHNSSDTPYVYEVNTAPGIEGTTLLKYTQAFQGIYDNL